MAMMWPHTMPACYRHSMTKRQCPCCMSAWCATQGHAVRRQPLPGAGPCPGHAPRPGMHRGRLPAQSACTSPGPHAWHQPASSASAAPGGAPWRGRMTAPVTRPATAKIKFGYSQHDTRHLFWLWSAVCMRALLGASVLRWWRKRAAATLLAATPMASQQGAS